MKQCTKCNQIKPFTEFNKASTKSGYVDGYISHCKECRKAYAAGRKHISKETRAAWVSKPENRAKKREWERRRRVTNTVDTMFLSVKSRANRRGTEFTIEKQDIVIPDKCPILECSFEFGDAKNHKYTHSLDRIDSKKGYIKGNVRVISYLANTMKNCASKEELLLFAKNIIKYLENDDIVQPIKKTETCWKFIEL